MESHTPMVTMRGKMTVHVTFMAVVMARSPKVIPTEVITTARGT